MDRHTVKAQLVRDKEFLRDLYQTPDATKAKQIIIFSSDAQLNTLIKFLHFLSTGEITILKENFEKIVHAKKLHFLKKHVEKKQAVSNLMRADRKAKILFLKKLVPLFPSLLYCLFNQ